MLVDDDRGNAIIFKRALENLKITNPLVHSINCKVALEYLRDQNSEKPWLIITDLNTPKMKGFEFLKAVKLDELLSQIPVIILTGTSDENDVVQSFQLGAAGYMFKPTDFKNLVEMVRTIHEYWSLSKSPVLSLDSRLDQPPSLEAATKQ